MTRAKLLVCDLDNTIYDWVSYFVEAFYAMVDDVVRVTGCDREQLLDDFRTVHRRHHDSEHPFALLETETVRRLFPAQSRTEIAERLDSAFHAFNAKRKQTLRLYTGVRETLDILSDAGVVIVAHTESNLYAAADRLTRLDLSRYFRRVYCRERAETVHPNPDAAQARLDAFPVDIVELSHHQRKPSPEVLMEICGDEGISVSDSAYVGDSISRDMYMARSTGVFAIWAKYGTIHEPGKYEKLVRITHWTEEDVARERDLAKRAEGTAPDYVLEHQFGEILPALLPTRGGNYIRLD